MDTNVLNLLNGGDECADQMAASAVYHLAFFISSHSFVYLYAVDFINYIKSGGKSLQEVVNILDEKDVDLGHNSTPEKDEDYADQDTDYGQGVCSTREKLSEDDYGGVRICIVRGMDDCTHRGEELTELSAYICKSLIRKVSTKQLENQSKVGIHTSALKSKIF